MQDPVILAIDQGTTNTKALLVATDGSVLLARSRPNAIRYPHPGWAEQCATEIWETVSALIDETVAAADRPIAALAISNQRETILLWDAETGEPLAPAVIWQCRRTEERCAELRAAGHGDSIMARSGLGLDPLFPAAKIAWLLDNVPGARHRAEAGALRCGTIDSWLLWKLTDGVVHATDHSNASRTQLFNLDRLEWDAELAVIFDVPLALLPKVMPSDSQFGLVAPSASAIAAGIPIHAMLGDSHAALFAHGIVGPGRAKATIGTGSSIMAATETRIASRHGLSSTIAWSRGDTVQYALEGNIAVSGHAAAFAAGLLGLADESALTELAASVEDSGGVVFVPALAGLGAPHWRSEARGTISGMSLATRPAHVARATLEAIALQIGDVVDAAEVDLAIRLPELSIDGGAARNPLLVRIMADLLNRVILRPEIAEASALGVARLAAEALGISRFQSPAIAERVAPRLAEAQREQVRSRWRRAIGREA